MMLRFVSRGIYRAANPLCFLDGSLFQFCRPNRGPSARRTLAIGISIPRKEGRSRYHRWNDVNVINVNVNASVIALLLLLLLLLLLSGNARMRGSHFHGKSTVDRCFSPSDRVGSLMSFRAQLSAYRKERVSISVQTRRAWSITGRRGRGLRGMFIGHRISCYPARCRIAAHRENHNNARIVIPVHAGTDTATSRFTHRITCKR